MIHAALLVAMVFPHSALSFATLLTEAPALLLATTGSILWIRTIRGRDASSGDLATGLLGGALIGLSIFCRQYYLALLPTMLMSTVWLAFRAKQSRTWWIVTAASVLCAAGPGVLLICIWGGLASPAMESGGSYNDYRAAMGLNPFRVLIALLYVALYLCPFTFPLIVKLSPRERRLAGAAGLAGAGAAGFFWGSLFQWGPLRSIVLAAGRIPYGSELSAAALGGVAAVTLVATAAFLTRNSHRLRPDSLVAFSALTVFFFVLEQCGVGGNIQFYERYMLQIAPFLGIIGFFALPSVDRTRLAMLLLLLGISIAGLWRYR